MKKNGNPAAPSSYVWRAETGAEGGSLAHHVAQYLAITEREACDLIDFGSVYVEGRPARDPRRELRGEEEIRVNWPRLGIRRFYEIDPARIVFRDAHLLAYDKEPGIPSQQTPADAHNNLFAALGRYLDRDHAHASRAPYVALHHRLDKDTSGIILFALDRSINTRLGTLFQQRRVTKEYLAWVEGSPATDRWTATDDIGRAGGRYCVLPKGRGKGAETVLEVLCRDPDRSLVRAQPKTGRTHQIRLHLAACGHPVVGDSLYGKRAAQRLYLHAHRLGLIHPVTGAKLSLVAPVPEDWPEPGCPTFLH